MIRNPNNYLRKPSYFDVNIKRFDHATQPGEDRAPQSP